MKSMRLTVIGAVLTLTGVVLAPPASAATPAQILQAGAELGVRDGYPGVIGLVGTGSGAQVVKAGQSNRFTGVPADPSMKFRIGSNTKAFVSTVLLQLASEGKLSLDDTVARWLPDAVRTNGHDGTKISIRQLLNQTSGLPDYAGDARVSVPYIANTDPRQPWSPQSLVDIALSAAPVGAPGEKFFYANTNYVLAGMAIKAVTGNEPVAEIQRRIIEPLGLKDTTYPTADPAMPANSLGGHFWVGNFLIRDVTTSNVQTFGPAGAMVSTLTDLAAFERALFSGKLLPPAQMTELKTTVPVGGGAGYGLGVGSAPTPCGPVWNHNGAVLGYYSLWLTSEDGNKQVVVAANEFHMMGGTRGQQDITKAALDAYCAL
ncbi:penicillin-binding protein [Actinosynnema sp. ALI-1.44]|uniref:serine hydrolase domain-containing protein n=1 Tax=Actinosynnema sp. ALI-1.44 TaxID=1933779 RepID=UPI00097BE1D0|nr:serine hydrolase domain-containing protein [Actinosynnema sp. ALI-1.44]ONI75132.1 penicillin-binding protein [Actinosynnema sp. ALI-1.44]